MTTTIYTIYKTTNTINGKIYIGSHKQDINEKLYYYIGSGTIFKRALNKYGEDKFFKRIIHVFDNSSDMYNMEAEIVNQEFIDRRDTYNIKLGGHGGWDYINETRDHHLNSIKAAKNRDYSKSDYSYVTDEYKNNKSKMTKQYWKEGKMKLPPGTKGMSFWWITDGLINKKIRLIDDLPIKDMPEGFKRGRTI